MRATAVYRLRLKVWVLRRMASLCTSRVMRSASASACLRLLLATWRCVISLGLTGRTAILTSKLHCNASLQDFSLQNNDVQPMWTVYSADQWTHISGSTGAGDENEIASQSLASKHIFTKQVARLRHDVFRGNHRDVQRREQARHAGLLKADVNTDRPGASHSRERFGNASRGVHHLVGSGTGLDPRVACEVGEQLGGKVLRRSEQN